MAKSCANCGCKDVEKSEVEYPHMYGAGEDQIEIISIIPIHTCCECRFEWYDFEAEEIMDKDTEKFRK